MRVLVAEPDCESANSLRQHMRRHGYETEIADTGAGALGSYQEYDLLILDLELPDVDGLQVCRSIRTTSDIPIIAFTSHGTELDRVLCLQAGCDDCLVKPFGFRELVARIEAIMRRIRPRAMRSRRLSHGPLHIDRDRREVYLHDTQVKVTRKEFDLLQFLASQPTTVFSREQLMTEVWGASLPGGALGSNIARTIDTHVGTLRNKLGSSEWIITVRGVGFRFGGVQQC
ncbi:response regulator transcription factor [Streptomyces chattanoogensis]|uniref:Transcriptional regulator n=1 Tax=Streptomyces chattanoogensis TaxID=66876 RepID=A0A0N0H4A0_9ACTN|nr:response regulator transcription factor [Streptomyces chattanoogensis]KPC66670.1 transcriptional regulator [Streptomyces chattanoogensis]